MKTTIQINGKDVEITLTEEQVAQINKPKTIESLEDAISYLGECDEEVVNLRQLQKITISDKILAKQEAVCFVRALNEKHVFDWNNSNERKWRIWWSLDKEFCFTGSSYSVSISFVASSLSFKSEKLAYFAGNNKNYTGICKRFMY
jgi:hypothetical protein